MPLAFTSAPATVGEAPAARRAVLGCLRAHAAAADADADADYISRAPAGRPPPSEIPEETSDGKPTPAEPRRLSRPTRLARRRRRVDPTYTREGASIAVPR